ncbi:oxidoreductase [Amylocystis lapponica]|nr:oxidoreductase [Amylocystis lapponica]
MFFKKRWDPRGQVASASDLPRACLLTSLQHCFVTGGSSGLGLAVAVLLARKGAHVSVVARNEMRLQEALKKLEAVRQSPDQVFRTFSYAVDNAADAAASLEAACEAHGGRCPDAHFFCAGKAKPGFFVEQDESSLRQCMEETYWAQAWSALAAAKRMVRHHSKGKIIFVSSVVGGYMSIAGWTPYSPGKFAIRGKECLAESLHSELMLYDIDVHICFPGSILTPGYEEENQLKPKIMLEIEESDPGAAPDQVASAIVQGVQKGHFHITHDWVTDIFRTTTAGSSPRNNRLVDFIYGVIGFLILPPWRKSVDSKIREHRQEHQEYLTAIGFFNDTSK